MAPIKRVRSTQEEDAAPDSSAPDSRKKIRFSDALAGENDTDSDQSTTNSPSGSSSGPSSSDNDDDGNTTDEAELEERATQTVRKQYERHEENTPMEYGIIERVDCYNFMCHEHFCVELGPLLNFIVGKNGSGKSAILTAITLCLGGKASATNRGQSLKSFVKEGKDSATIIVRLKNQGEGGYCPHEYGKSIIVERHFTKSGTSGFRIKNASGRVVSTKKGDLDAITDYFALQIDNPMNVLSQDMARQFIGSSSSSEKYKFFVKGVQLEQLDQDYRLIEEFIEQVKGKMALHQEEMKALETKRERAKARLALSDRQEGLRDRIRNIRAQMAWAQVEEQERLRDSCVDKVAECTQKITDLEGEVARIDQAFQEAEQEYEAAKRAAQEAKAIVDEHTESRKSIEERQSEQLKERKELQVQQRTISEHLRAAETRIKETQANIEEETKKLAELDGGGSARLQADLDEKMVLAEEAKTRYQQHQQTREQCEEDVSKVERDVGVMKDPISRKQTELSQAQNRLRILKRDRGQQQSGFAERMPMLIRAIEQDNSFSRPPVGPLGNHVRLIKPQWSSILENTFGATLSSFVVTSKRDMNTLSKIMERVNCVCPIFIGDDSGDLNTAAHEPDSSFDTALRVLEIDNDLVRRQLVINHGVEQMLLIEDLQEASSTLFDGQRPKNVRRCYCIDKKDKRRGIHLAFTRMGEPTQSPVSAYNGQPRMKTDAESQVRMQQEAVDNLDSELKELIQQKKQAEIQLQTCRRNLKDHGNQEQHLQLESQKADDTVEELRDEIGRGKMRDSQLDAFKTMLEEAEEEKRLNEASYEDSVNAVDAVIQRLRTIKRELATKDNELGSVQEDLNSREEEERQASEKRRAALGDKNVAIGHVEEARRDKVTAEEKQEELNARVLDFNEKANLVSPRVPVDDGETAAGLDRKLEKLMRDLQRYNEEMGASREEIAAAAADANEKYEISHQQVMEFRETTQTLKTSLMNRRDRWMKFRAYISSRAKVQFTYLLSERSYRGKLFTDHKEKRLDLHVEPDITHESAGRSTTTLSGGEKSFSQICLLLSLWEAMGSPIRCLDEFDVYMDSINRKMTIDMLMSAARRSVGRQFVLITPGSQKEIQPAPDVRVKQLAEPERGQQTLQFAG